MKHGSLFSGIGGFDLAAEWMGWENVFHCEWNPFGQKVLKYYWPNAASYGDITKTDFTKYRGTINVLTGGFPCQPYSNAGKRKGKEDERHLWPEMLRAIREIQPEWVVGENVRGLVNWSGGLVFEEVQAQLEAEGYEVQPFLLPSCGVDAPHKRERIWFVAHATSYRSDGRATISNRETQSQEKRNDIFCQTTGFSIQWVTSYTHSKRLEWNNQSSKRCNGFRGGISLNVVNSFLGSGTFTNSNSERVQRSSSYGKIKTERKRSKQFTGRHYQQPNWDHFPTQSPVCFRDDGLSSELDGITFSNWRKESIKGGGNAIVPQVALQIFKAIEISADKEA